MRTPLTHIDKFTPFLFYQLEYVYLTTIRLRQIQIIAIIVQIVEYVFELSVRGTCLHRC